ncbi:hypothetical protein ABFS83_08G206300 [Erythranthe nasuta]
MLKEEKSELEKRHGVCISDAAFDLADNSQLFPEKCVRRILDEACKLVQENFTSCRNEIDQFNDNARELGQTLVELTELHRDDNSSETQFWVDRLKSERDSASFHINGFFMRWGFEKDFIFCEDAEKIRSLRDRVIASSDFDPNFTLIIDQFLVDIQRSIFNRFPGNLTVRACHVAEVISRLTDVPFTQIIRSNINSHKKKAVKMTNKRVVNQKHVVKEIFKILASEKTVITNRPRGSFLLVGPTGVGKREIAKSVALHWYSDASRLVEIDMSEYADDYLSYCCNNFCLPFIGSKTKSSYKHQQNIWNRLTEVVAKRPYSVILLHNVDKDCFNTLTKVLLRISSDESVDFSKSIIFMTSSSNPLELDKTRDCTLKDTRVEGTEINCGALLPCLDKVLAVECSHDQKAVARLLLREIVREAYGERYVVHASNAALDVLFLMAHKQCIGEDGNAIKNALIEHIISPLSLIAKDLNNAFVCVDTCVGSSKLSFRVEPHDSKSVASRYFNFKDGTFDEFITDIKTTMEALAKIFHLRCQFSDFTESGQNFSPLNNLLLEACDGLLVHAISLHAYKEMLIETKNKVMKLQRQFSDLPESDQEKLVSKACNEIAVRYNISPTREVDKEIASNGPFPTAEEQEKFKFVSKSLQESNKIGIGKAVKAIVDALVEMSDSSLELPNLPPRNYMFEGLNHEAKTKLIRCLGDSLGDSFFTYIKLDENYKGGKKEKESLIGKVKENPCMVVLIDGIEFAHGIFYKSLLDIFDKGVLDDCEGLGVEFWRSIIILTSTTRKL